MRFSKIRSKICSHQRQGEDGHIEGFALKRDAGHITGNDVLIDRNMVKAVHSMTAGKGLSEQRLATSEIADNFATAQTTPADHFLIGDDCPLFALLSIQGMVMGPLLGICLQALMGC